MYSPLDDLLGIHLHEVSPDRVTASLMLDPTRHHQPWGIAHGGLWCTVVETLASVGAHQSAPPGRVAVGMDNHTSFLRMMREGTVTAEALPVTRGRTTQLWTVTIRDEEGKPIAQGTCRLLFVAAEPASQTAADSRP